MNTDTPNTDAEWSSEAPTIPGDYLFRCGETDDTPELKWVYEKDGELWVQCIDVGDRPLKMYYDNLQNPRWKTITLPPSETDEETIDRLERELAEAREAKAVMQRYVNLARKVANCLDDKTLVETIEELQSRLTTQRAALEKAREVLNNGKKPMGDEDEFAQFHQDWENALTTINATTGGHTMNCPHCGVEDTDKTSNPNNKSFWPPSC